MSQLPKGWVETELGNVTNYGATIKPDLKNIEDDCWVLELEDIEKDSSKLLKRLNFGDRSPKSSKNSFVKGDVLYGKLRPYLNKMLIASEDGICTTEIVPLKVPNDLFENRFLFYWLKGKPFSDYVNAVSYGVNMPRLGTKDGKKAPMIVAPLAEQKRIVEKLDEVLAQVDTIKARLDGIPDLLKRFRQSVLASAVSGKLTEEWRKKSDMPLGQTKALKNAGKVIAGQSPSRAEVNSDGCGEPYVTGPEQWDGKKILHHKWTMYPKRMAPDGSIFVTVKGAGVGTTFPGCYAAIGRDVYAFVPSEQMQYKYILYAIQASAQDVVLKAKGLIPGLTKSDIIDHCVYLPRIEEQKEIVRLVDQYFAFSDTIGAQVKKAQSRVDNLTQSILAKAFRGELVPQDPNDEPAEKLLERIAEARKEAEALAKAAKKAENAKKRAAKKAAENN